jgi:hypothetical protein
LSGRPQQDRRFSMEERIIWRSTNMLSRKLIRIFFGKNIA